MNSKMITAKHLALRENQNSTRARIENHRMKFLRAHPGVFLANGKTTLRPVSARVENRWSIEHSSEGVSCRVLRGTT